MLKCRSEFRGADYCVNYGSHPLSRHSTDAFQRSPTTPTMRNDSFVNSTNNCERRRLIRPSPDRVTTTLSQRLTQTKHSRLSAINASGGKCFDE
eukprot:scaffold11328_cov66-Cyclotella_meneghiniana.AAC.4